MAGYSHNILSSHAQMSIKKYRRFASTACQVLRFSEQGGSCLGLFLAGTRNFPRRGKLRSAARPRSPSALPRDPCPLGLRTPRSKSAQATRPRHEITSLASPLRARKSISLCAILRREFVRVQLENFCQMSASLPAGRQGFTASEGRTVSKVYAESEP